MSLIRLLQSEWVVVVISIVAYLDLPLTMLVHHESPVHLSATHLVIELVELLLLIVLIVLVVQHLETEPDDLEHLPAAVLTIELRLLIVHIVVIIVQLVTPLDTISLCQQVLTRLSYETVVTRTQCTNVQQMSSNNIMRK